MTPEEMRRGFSDRVVEHLVAHDLSQAELARRSNMSPDTLRAVLRSSNPMAYTAWRIARGMNVSVDYLLTGASRREYYRVTGGPSDV